MLLCRAAGPLVRPQLGQLVPPLLEAVAGLEHQVLGYSATRASEEDRDRLDALRVSAARASPMADTLNYVLRYVDETVLDEVIGGVVEVLKRSVGLTSRTTAAHVIETLTHTLPPGAMEKHAGKILAALFGGLSDRNATVRQTFAKVWDY